MVEDHPCILGRSRTKWSQMTASDPHTAGQLGYSVGISGDTSVAGALYDDAKHNAGGAPTCYWFEI